MPKDGQDAIQGLNDAQQLFLSRYIRKLPRFGKGKVERSNNDLTAKLGQFETRYRRVKEQIDKAKAKGHPGIDQLNSELMLAGEVLNRNLKEPNFDGAQQQLGFVMELIRDPTAGNPPGMPPKKTRDVNERAKFLEKVKHSSEMLRQTHRSDTVKSELKGLKNARDKLDQAIKTLSAEAKDDSNDIGTLRKLQEEYREKVAARDALDMRIRQFEQYEATEAVRIDRMMDASDRMTSARDFADGVADALVKAPLGPIPELEKLTESVRAPTHTDVADARAKNRELGTRVLRDASRVLRADMIFPGEPEIMAISREEAKSLAALLKTADSMIVVLEKGEAVTKGSNGKSQTQKVKQSDTERQLKYIAALHNRVASDLALFSSTRSTGLPFVPSPDPDAEAVLTARLERLEARMLDLYGRGSKDEPKLSGEVAALRKDLGKPVKTDSNGDPDYSDLIKEFDRLEKAADTAFSVLVAPVETETVKKARAVAGNVAAALAKDFFQGKVLSSKDADRIDLPGKDWGEEGKPKDAIPFDEVMQVPGPDGNPTYFRIATKSQKGVSDVTRRKDKHIPREVLNMLKDRAETLALMAETMGEGCEDILKAYADETEQMMKDYVGTEAHTEYDKIEELLGKIEKDYLKHKTVLAFQPVALPQFQADWAAFKSGWLKKSPKDALGEITALKTRAEALLSSAKSTETLHKENDRRIGWVFLQLASVLDQQGMGGSSDLGTKMADLLNGGALRLAKAKNADPAIIQEIEAAMKTVADNSKLKLNLSDYQGTWRRDMERANRFNIEKNEGAVVEAKKVLDPLFKSIENFQNSMDKIGSLKGDDLNGFLKDLAAKMKDSAEGAVADVERHKLYEAELATLSKLRKEVEKASGGKLSKKDFESRLKGLIAQKDAIKKDVEKTMDYEGGRKQLATLALDFKSLAAAAGLDSAGKDSGPGKIKVKPRADALVQSLVTLADAAANLVKVNARKKASPTQLSDPKIVKNLDDAEKTLGSIKDIADASALAGLADKIDKGHGDPKAMKFARREEALVILRRLRARIESHPGVKLYQENPFDQGIHFSPVRNNLHFTEIGILTSVDPRERD